MANEFTAIRQAIEKIFADHMSKLVDEIWSFNEAAGIASVDPQREITKWLRVDPLAGPVDPFFTNARWKFTRNFQVLFNLPKGVMDIGQLEAIERAIMGCMATLTNQSPQLGLDYVTAVRCTGGDYGMFIRDEVAKMQSRVQQEGDEMWAGVAKISVEFQKTRTEVATWIP